MIEQREVLKAKLRCDVAQQSVKLRETCAGSRCFSKAVAQTPH
jgi:hypothetical protein